jgi:drug/metabolite transporter (DMT)-like permease
VTTAERGRQRQGVAELALVSVAAVWGVTFVMVKDAIETLPAMAFLGFRFLAAALLVTVVFRHRVARLSRAGLRAGLVMGVFLTAGYVFQTIGLEYTTASNGGFITGLMVVITPVLAAVFLRERVGRAGWAAALVSAFGLYLLSGSEGFNKGDALTLLCAAAFAAHIIVTSRAAPDHDAGALLVVQLGFCGVFCTLVAAIGGQLEVPRGGNVWSALIVTSVLASALAFFVQTYAQRHAPPSRTALILAAEPAFAGLFGYLFAGDRLSAVAWLGAGLIMASILAVELAPRLRPPRPLPEA